MLPPIPLDAYHLCAFVRYRTPEVVYTSISLLFGGFELSCKPDGTKSTLNIYKSDFLAFSLIIYRIIRVRKNALGHKFATILDTVAEDSMWYFLLVFSAHFTLVMTLNLARVSATVSHPGLQLILSTVGLYSRRSNFFQPRELSRSYPENDPPPHFSSLHYDQWHSRVGPASDFLFRIKLIDAWAQVSSCYGLKDSAIVEESGEIAT